MNIGRIVVVCSVAVVFLSLWVVSSYAQDADYTQAQLAGFKELQERLNDPQLLNEPFGYWFLYDLTYPQHYIPADLRKAIMDFYLKTTLEENKSAIIRAMQCYITDEEVTFLIKQYNQTDSMNIKSYILGALNRYPNKDAVDFALEILKDPPRYVNMELLTGIVGQTHNTDYAPVVEKVYRQKNSNFVSDVWKRMDCLQALVELKGVDIQDELLTYINDPLGRLGEDNLFFLGRVCGLLEYCGDEEAIDPLITQMSSLETLNLSKGDTKNLQDSMGWSLKLITLKDFGMDFKKWEDWRSVNPDFDARKADAEQLKEYLAGGHSGKSSIDPYYAIIKTYYLKNIEALPYLKQILDLKSNQYTISNQIQAAYTLTKAGYREGYLFLINASYDEKLEEIASGLQGMCKNYLIPASAQNFPTKEEWLQWLDENKDRFKTISAE